jgi:hypothetical protein
MGFDSHKDRRFFFFRSVHTVSRVHLASYPLGTGVDLSGGKAPRREADHPLPSSAEFKNGGAIPPFPICLHGIIITGTTLPFYYFYIMHGLEMRRGPTTVALGVRTKQCNVSILLQIIYSAL